MSSITRPPLTPVSPNSSTIQHKRDVIRFAAERTALPGFGYIPAGGRVLRSPFASKCPDDDKSHDAHWIQFFEAFGERSWPLDSWIAQLRKVDAGRKFDEGFTFDGMENYESHVAYGVTHSEMVGVLSGRDTDVEVFLRAEGLLCRLLFVVYDHPTRVAILKTWLVAVGRVMGGSAVVRFDGALAAIKTLGSVFSGCSPTGGFLSSFQRHAAEQVRRQQVWLYVSTVVDSVRDEQWGAFSYDVEMCCVHFRGCVDAMECSQLDWEDTQPNTPERVAEDRAEEEEHLAVQKAADFYGGKWPYPGFTDEED